MGKKVNLLEALGAYGSERPGLERVRLGNDEAALIPFTAEGEEVDLHFCDEPDINDYVACNGPGCPLCSIGRKQVKRRLLPVYVPGARAVGVLPVSTSLRPGSLWPQLADALNGEEPHVVFVTRDPGERYRVSAVPLRDDVEAGEGAIKEFLADYKAGHIVLDSVYQRISNEELARLPDVAVMLKLKGITLG
jgi:hypothetical protein